VTGAGPTVEIFDDRMEITNPGEPLVDPLCFVDTPQRLAQGTTPIAGPRQHLLHQHKVGPAHRFIGRAASTVGFEHLVYHFPQPRLALGDLATTTARTADALGTATGTLWGG